MANLLQVYHFMDRDGKLIALMFQEKPQEKVTQEYTLKRQAYLVTMRCLFTNFLLIFWTNTKSSTNSVV